MEEDEDSEDDEEQEEEMEEEGNRTEMKQSSLHPFLAGVYCSCGLE